MATTKTEGKKQFPLLLSGSEDEQLTASAARSGLSKQEYAKRAIRSAMLQDAALEKAAECLEIYGVAFGMDAEGVAAKVAELRAGERLAA